MASHRPKPSRKFIDRKSFALVGPTSYHNSFVCATSGTASKSATPVEAAPEVVLLTAKTILITSAATMQRRGVSSLKKHPHLPEAEHFLHQNAASDTMVRLADCKNSLGRAYKVRSRGQVGTPSKKERSGRPVYQIKAGAFSFQNLVQTPEALKQIRTRVTTE